MTSRRALHSYNNFNGSSSPVRNNQSSSRSPCRANNSDEWNSSGDENKFEESIDNPTNLQSAVKHSDEEVLEHTSEVEVHERLNHSFQKIRTKQRPSYKPESASSSSFPMIFCAVIVLAIVLGGMLYLKSQPEKKRCSFEELRQRPPLQSSEVWTALRVNIELLLNKKTNSPNIFLLLHTNQSSETEMRQLSKDIASEASKCFDGQRPIEMNLKDFETNSGDDYGYPIEQYKKKISNGNVFLIVDLNAIPPNAARALHTICDIYSPIAPGVVIFLTLRTHLSKTDSSPGELAYKTLVELWKQLPDNELDPLITRVIDQVLMLHS